MTNGIYKYWAVRISPYGIIHRPGLFIVLFVCAFPPMSLSLPEPILKSIHLEAYFISY